MRFYPFSILIFLSSLVLFSSCKDQEKIITKPEGSWKISRISENLSFTEGLVAFRDTAQAGEISFHEDGTATLLDGNGEMTLNWSYDKSTEIISLTEVGYYQLVEGMVIERKDISFGIEESKSDEQLWRYEERFPSFNPFTGDSTTALLIIQWELSL